jgi:hypothetical protein
MYVLPVAAKIDSTRTRLASVRYETQAQTPSVILSKKVYMYMCPIPNGFRDRAVSLYRGATRHVLTRVAKCTDVDGGIFEMTS